MEDLVKRRVERLKKLLDSGVNPFEKTKFEATSSSDGILREFGKLSPGEETKSKAKLAGRVMSIRVHGGVAFLDLQDSKGRLQMVFRKDISSDAFKLVEEFVDEGDTLGVSGRVIKTRRGQLSLLVESADLLSKSLRPIPSEWYGLKNVETRYRQRYLDLLLNKDVRDGFVKISRLINGMRGYLTSNGFVEVSTPILQPIYGGAFAKPFKTHHNFLKQDMFLRIAPELYLKRLIAGGFDKVFEVSPCFRNESVDSTHNPEFTQIEVYQAYANYEDMMVLTENMVSEAVKAAVGDTKIEFQGKTIEFKPPWKRLTMEDALKGAGLNISKMGEKEIMKEARKSGIKAQRLGNAIEDLFSEKAQPMLVQPTFITDFPADISPLAKRFPDNPKMAQRFEVYVAGMEAGNAFSELNNPIEQYARFKEEEELRKKTKSKDLEYMPMDKDYIRALEYGMPPTGGLGIGIARISSIILDKPSIKEVLLFPAVAGIERIKTVAEMFPDLAEKLK